MSVQLLQDLRIAGAVNAAGSIVTLGVSAEAELVSRGVAVWSGSDLTKLPGSEHIILLGQQHVAASKSDLDANESASLYTLELPGSTLGPNSALRITQLWTVPTGAATKRLRGRFGGVVLWNIDLSTHVTYHYMFILRNRNSRASQVAQPNNTAPWGTFASNAVQTFSVDFAAAQTLTITAQWPVAGAGSNNITLESVTVEHLPGA